MNSRKWGRPLPSRSFCYQSNKTSEQARAEFSQPTNLGVIFIPGILSESPQSYVQNLEFIASLHQNKAFKVVHNSSGGRASDLREVSDGALHRITPPVIELVLSIKQFVDKNKGAKLHIIAHSQGCIHLKNALKELDQKTRDQLIITAVGPAAYIKKELCKNVRHVASTEDLVACTCLIGKSEKDKVTWIEMHKDAQSKIMEGGDHGLTSPTVKKEIEKRSEEISEKQNVTSEQIALENKKRVRMQMQAARTYRV